MGKKCQHCGGVSGACLAPTQAGGSGGKNLITWKADATGATCMFVGEEVAKQFIVADVPNNQATLDATGALFVRRPALETISLQSQLPAPTVANGATGGFVYRDWSLTHSALDPDDPAISWLEGFQTELTAVKSGVYTIDYAASPRSIVDGGSAFLTRWEAGITLDSELNINNPAFGLPRSIFGNGNSFPTEASFSEGTPRSTISWTGRVTAGEVFITRVDFTASSLGAIAMGDAFVTLTYLGPDPTI